MCLLMMINCCKFSILSPIKNLSLLNNFATPPLLNNSCCKISKTKHQNFVNLDIKISKSQHHVHVITDSQLWILNPCSQFNGSLFELKGLMKEYATCTQEIGFKTLHLWVEMSLAMCIVQFLLKSEKPLLIITRDNLTRC